MLLLFLHDSEVLRLPGHRRQHRHRGVPPGVDQVRVISVMFFHSHCSQHNFDHRSKIFEQHLIVVNVCRSGCSHACLLVAQQGANHQSIDVKVIALGQQRVVACSVMCSVSAVSAGGGR
jgi:hypothetical protein